METVHDGKQSWGFEGDADLGGLNDHFAVVIDQFDEMLVQFSYFPPPCNAHKSAIGCDW